MVVLAVSNAGCAVSLGNLLRSGWGNQPCVLPPDASAEEIVTHLNANVSQLTAWRSDDVQIQMGARWA